MSRPSPLAPLKTHAKTHQQSTTPQQREAPRPWSRMLPPRDLLLAAGFGETHAHTTSSPGVPKRNVRCKKTAMPIDALILNLGHSAGAAALAHAGVLRLAALANPTWLGDHRRVGHDRAVAGDLPLRRGGRPRRVRMRVAHLEGHAQENLHRLSRTRPTKVTSQKRKRRKELAFKKHLCNGFCLNAFDGFEFTALRRQLV